MKNFLNWMESRNNISLETERDGMNPITVPGSIREWKPYVLRYKGSDGYVDWVEFRTEEEAVHYMLSKRYHGRIYTLYHQPTASSDKTTIMQLAYGTVLS